MTQNSIQRRWLAYLTGSLLSMALLAGPPAQAEQVRIELALPAIASSQYQRPYLAVWLEAPDERRALRTLAVWHEDRKWLKDIRRWWRKAGRYDEPLDGATGATRPPGRYRLEWDGRDKDGQPLPAGDYLLCLEAVREHGNRTLLKQPIRLGAGPQQYRLAAGDELGPVTVAITED